jgi:hypothetical protein
MKSVKVGYMDIPQDYFELDSINKETVCLVLLDGLLTLVDKRFDKQYNRKDILNKLIESSIETNIKEETYEVAAVLRDIKTILNEPIN